MFWKNKEKSIRNRPKVLVVEPHPYHDFLLPGVSKYFIDLGYDVDVLINKECKRDNSFYRFDFPLHIKYFSTKNLAKLLKHISEYDYLFITSLEYWIPGIETTDIFSILKFIPKPKHKVLGLIHTLKHLELFKIQDKLENCGQSFSISGQMLNDKLIPMLYPFYFGKVDFNKPKGEKVRFITAGVFCKDYDLLTQTVDKLLEKGITNFEIIVVTKKRLKFKSYKKHIKGVGHLTYPQLYKEMEKSDYYLPLLNPENPIQQHFLDGSTSGSMILSLGFLTPCLINDQFAKVYRLNDKNSIIYKNGELAAAMEKAINQSQSEYQIMQADLKLFSDEMYKQSLENLKKTCLAN